MHFLICDNMNSTTTSELGSTSSIAILISTTVASLPTLQPPLKGSQPAVESTWWMIIGIVAGVMLPMFIMWIAVKIIDIRRHGLKFDYFHEDITFMDMKSATDINFLYNKAELGIKYKEVQEPKSPSKSPKKSSSVRKKVKLASASLIDKFDLKGSKKRRKLKSDRDEEELRPVSVKNSKKNKNSNNKTNVNFNGRVVQVALKKMEVGRARPLPPLPPS